MLRPLALILLIASLCAAPRLTMAEPLDAVLTAALSGTKTPALGAVVIQNGAIAGMSVRGSRRDDRPEPVRVEDVWMIGSDLKPMTAAMIARLVDEGRLSWRTPLPELLPSLAGSVQPDYHPVTLLELLSHRAGLPHDATDVAFIETFFEDRRPLQEQRLAYLARALLDAPVARPSTTFNYSNTGFIAAAAIAEHATGLSCEELMRREVFEPLGMKSVGFGPTHDGQLQGHRGGRAATPHDSGPLLFESAGIAYMSLGDWAKFCTDQLAGAKGHGRLLSAQSYRLMQTPPAGSEAALDWGLDPDIAGFKGPVLAHQGSDHNWFVIAVLFPQSGNGLLIAANAGQDMGGDTAAVAALKALLPRVSMRKEPPR